MRCALPTLEVQARPVSRAGAGACRCQAPNAPPPHRPDPPPPLPVPPAALLRSAALLSAMAASEWLLHCDAADAAAGRGWRPRRHHRRLGQQEREANVGRYAQEATKRAHEAFNDVMDAPLPAQVQDQVGSAIDEVRGLAADLQHMAATLQHTLARALHVEPRAERQPELHISVAARPAPPARLRRAGEDGPGIVALYAALAVAGALGAVWAVRAASNARGRRAQGGRWVRDRSLGGKMVFVEDAPARPPPDRTSDFDLPGQREAAAAMAGPAAPAAAPTAPAAAAEGARADGAGEEAMPEWWSLGPRHRASGAFREQAAKRARGILVELEDAKLAGRDYDVGLLLALRQVCGEAGVSVRARTESGRDALFRAGAEAAASAAMDAATSQLGGAAPARFVTGLARDLEVPEEWAATMSLGVVAGRARGALVDACAAYRASDSQEAVYQLLRLAGLLDALPLPPGSAQADMVAAGIANRATLPEREAIFLTYGKMEPHTADRVAEMLGFNPDLVMPRLRAHAASSTPFAGAEPGAASAGDTA